MANLISDRTAAGLRRLLGARDKARASERPGVVGERRPMSHRLRIVYVAGDGLVLQVFADGPLWQDGDDEYSTMNNVVVDGKWRTVGEAVDGTVYSILLTAGTVDVSYTLPSDREDYIQARPIGVIADGKIRQVAEGLLWTGILGETIEHTDLHYPEV